MTVWPGGAATASAFRPRNAPTTRGTSRQLSIRRGRTDWVAASKEPAKLIQAQAERVTGGIQEDAEGRTRLTLVLSSAEFEHRRLGGRYVVDDHVEMHLLRYLLAGPFRC